MSTGQLITNSIDIVKLLLFLDKNKNLNTFKTLY